MFLRLERRARSAVAGVPRWQSAARPSWYCNWRSEC